MGFREEVDNFRALCRLLFSQDMKLEVDFEEKGLTLFSIPYLPSEISELVSLECLDIDDSPELTELPPEIGQLKNLRYLRLSHSNVHSLPFEIGRLVNLEELIITSLPLIQLPPEIENLKKLTTIKLASIPLTSFPKIICKLENLEVVYLVNLVKISEIPKEFTKLNKLKSVELKALRGLYHPPDEINHLIKCEIKWSMHEVIYSYSTRKIIDPELRHYENKYRYTRYLWVNKGNKYKEIINLDGTQYYASQVFRI